MKAISYIRWSSEKQAKGSSLARQKRANADFIDTMKWQFDSEIIDAGTSAWTGSNLSDLAAFGQFISKCEREGGKGYVLVVEQIDRISRLNTLDVILTFERLTKTGLTIALSDSRMVVDTFTLRNQSAQLQHIASQSERANSESNHKSQRIREAWQIMRDNKEPTHCSSTCPAWLRLDEARLKFSVRGDKALIVNEIFDLYIAGTGKRGIARILNDRAEPTFRGGNGWSGSSVASILHNRAVIGEYQHCVTRKAVGDPVADYFPAVMSNAKFAEANGKRHSRVMASHSHVAKLTNLLSDIARCSECGGKLIFSNKARKASGQPVAYLKCDNNMRSRGCTVSKMMPYFPLESAVLDALLDRILDDQHFQIDDDVQLLNNAIADQEREVADLGNRMETVANNLEKIGDDERLLTRYRTLKNDENAAKARLTELRIDMAKARGKVSSREHIKRVSDIRASLNDEDSATQARKLIKMALNDHIERLECALGDRRAVAHLLAGVAVIFFQDGKVIHYDLHKAGRDLSHREDREVIEAYLERTKT